MKNQGPQIRVQLMLPQEKVSLADKLRGAWQLVRADKPVGILLLIWPALWALWLAGDGNPDWYVTLVFLLVATLIRSAGCAINDFADRRIDGRVLRTCMRPVATGIIRPREALGVFAVLAAVALLLVTTLNLKTLLLMLVPLVLAVVYPYTKRYTHFPQVVLASSFGWSVPLAYAALEVPFESLTWVMYAVTVVWVMIYDTEYAMVDRDEDRLIGVKSIAILLDDRDVYAIGVMQVVVIGLLLWAGSLDGRGWLFHGGVLLSAIYFVRQQYLMHLERKAGAYAAFLNNNCFGMTLFVVLILDYLLT